MAESLRGDRETGREGGAAASSDAAGGERPRRASLGRLDAYLAALGLVALASAIGGALASAGIHESIVLLYTLAVVLAASRLGRGPAAVAAVLGVLAHAYFFVPPAFSLAITDVEAWLALVVLLVAGLVVGALTAKLGRYAEVAQRRARDADALRACARELSGAGREEAPRVAAHHLARHFGGRAFVATGDATGSLVVADSEGDPVLPEDRAALGRVALGGGPGDPDARGRGTRTLTASLATEGGRLGAVLVRRDESGFDAHDEDVVEAFARLTAESLERGRLVEAAERAEVEARTERLRNALLSSVSHDFRTPLAVIVGATTHLAEEGERLSAAERAELARSAEQEADRLTRLVNDLLSMTRLDAGAVRAAKEWQPIDDVVGAAASRMEKALEDRSLRIHLAPDLPLVPLDAVLVEQVLVNLLDNAVKHTPPRTPIEVSVARGGPDEVVVEVADRGPGLEPGSEETVFQRFQHGAGTPNSVGLGLAVCRGIVAVHGGRIWAERRDGGGVAFRFTLPIEGVPPSPPTPEADRAEPAA